MSQRLGTEGTGSGSHNKQPFADAHTLADKDRYITQLEAENAFVKKRPSSSRNSNRRQQMLLYCP